MRLELTHVYDQNITIITCVNLHLRDINYQGHPLGLPYFGSHTIDTTLSAPPKISAARSMGSLWNTTDCTVLVRERLSEFRNSGFLSIIY